MSVVMSIRPDNLTQIAGVLNKRTSASVEAYSCGFNYQTTNEFNVQISNVSTGGSVGTAYRWSNVGWSITRYQQITWTFDGTLGAAAKLRLWRDGTEQASTVQDVDNGGAVANTSDAIEFGRVNNGTLRYSGGIGYCYIFNTTLSPSEVQRLYQEPYAIVQPMPRKLWSVSGGAAASNAKLRRLRQGTRLGAQQGT